MSNGRRSKELTPREIFALLKAAQVKEEEIEEWHADFLHNCPSGRLDKKAFVEYYKKFNLKEKTDDAIEEIFDRIDVNEDRTVDFHEFLLVVVLMNRMNDLGQRLSFVFDMWDESGDGHIDKKELENVITAIYDRAGVTDRKGEKDPKKRAKEIIAKLDISGDKKLSKEEFLTGVQNDLVLRNLLSLQP